MTKITCINTLTNVTKIRNAKIIIIFENIQGIMSDTKITRAINIRNLTNQKYPKHYKMKVIKGHSVLRSSQSNKINLQGLQSFRIFESSKSSYKY